LFAVSWFHALYRLEFSFELFIGHPFIQKRFPMLLLHNNYFNSSFHG